MEYAEPGSNKLANQENASRWLRLSWYLFLLLLLLSFSTPVPSWPLFPMISYICFPNGSVWYAGTSQK